MDRNGSQSCLNCIEGGLVRLSSMEDRGAKNGLEWTARFEGHKTLITKSGNALFRDSTIALLNIFFGMLYRWFFISIKNKSRIFFTIGKESSMNKSSSNWANTSGIRLKSLFFYLPQDGPNYVSFEIHYIWSLQNKATSIPYFLIGWNNETMQKESLALLFPTDIFQTF